MLIDNIEKNSENPEHMKFKAGLYIVATPIGNLRDISMRALDILRAADIIYCEDTRVTRKLLGAYQIKASLLPYNDHSDESRRSEIIDRVKSGEVVALVSDAGMPLISDPGYKLVKDAMESEIYITTIPGANAPLAALQISGLPSDQFCFLGFLPNKTGARHKLLNPWGNVPATLITFTTAPRLMVSLKDIYEVLGEREVAVVREITKLYEEVRKGTPMELFDYYEEYGLPKGEIVLVIAPPKVQEISEDEVLCMLRAALKDMRTKDAASYVAEKTGKKKNDIYDLALKISKEL